MFNRSAFFVLLLVDIISGERRRLMRKSCASILSLSIAVSLSSGSAGAQQVVDPDFKLRVEKPAYRQGYGPLVLVDGGHYNFHTAGERYSPFAELLRRDGYRVGGSTRPFTKDALRGVRVLVIANALAEQNLNNWSLPTPSAFTDEEVAVVREWVKKGGSLLLIADHMPMPGAAGNLAAAFGIRMNNGFALVEQTLDGNLTFRRSDGSLAEHPITKGRTPVERVDSVATFTGSAFQADAKARPLLIFRAGMVSLMPTTAWEFTPQTPRVSVEGWLQGAVLNYGKGRVAVFGEAAMFTAQLAGTERRRVGMNAANAPHNAQFLLNVMRWLSGSLKS